MNSAEQQKDFWTRGGLPYLILILLCLAFYLPGLTRMPPTDRDEARFAQASRQMVESGNYIDIRFQQNPRYKKPAGIYWLQAASAAATTGAEKPAIWPYRLPSLLGALLAVLFTYRFGQALFGRRAALLGAALLGSSLILTAEAHLATTDAVLLACIVAMQGLLGRIYLRTRRDEPVGTATALLFWAACGAGILIKGPIAPAVALLTMGSLALADRNLKLLRQMRWRQGLLLLLVMVLPWFLAIGVETKGAFFQQAVGHDLLPKLAGGQESHGAPFGTFALLFPLLFWPGSLFAFWALWPSWKSRAEGAVRFCLAWIVPSWLMFELVPTKLPHYILPTFPAIALLTGYFLSHPGQFRGYLRQKPFTWLKWLPIALWGIVGVALAVGLTGLPLMLNHRLFLGSLAAIVGVAFLLAMVPRCWRKEKPALAALCGLLGGLLVLAPAFSLVLPRLDGPWISRRVLTEVRQLERKPHPVLAAVGFHEPSLVFLLGTQTELTDPAGAAQNLKAHANGLALVTQKEKEAFDAAARKEGVSPVALKTFRGFNYAKGRWLTLTLYGPAAPVPVKTLRLPNEQEPQ